MTTIPHETTREVPSWLAEMNFCHVVSHRADEIALCGHVCSKKAEHPYTPWRGEALCSGCGCPVCPRCVQLAALEDAL